MVALQGSRLVNSAWNIRNKGGYFSYDSRTRQIRPFGNKTQALTEENGRITLRPSSLSNKTQRWTYRYGAFRNSNNKSCWAAVPRGLQLSPCKPGDMTQRMQLVSLTTRSSTRTTRGPARQYRRRGPFPIRDGQRFAVKTAIGDKMLARNGIQVQVIAKNFRNKNAYWAFDSRSKSVRSFTDRSQVLTNTAG